MEVKMNIDEEFDLESEERLTWAENPDGFPIIRTIQYTQRQTEENQEQYNL